MKKRSVEFQLLLVCLRWPLTEDDRNRIISLLRVSLDSTRFLDLVNHHQVVPIVFRNLDDAARGETPEDLLSNLSLLKTPNACDSRAFKAAFGWPAVTQGGSTANVWNVLTIRCTRKLLRRLGAEAITDPPSPTNLLGDWYANLIFVGHTPLVICVSERSLLPVLVEVKGASSFHPRFLEAARSVLQGIGAERDTTLRLIPRSIL